MSDTSHDRRSRQADRPDEVIDPLLWGLALDVADAHQPDEDGGGHNLLCAGQAWPCAPWNNAQRALRLAQGGSEEGEQSSPRVVAGPAADEDPLTGWRSDLVPATSRRASSGASRSRRAASAA
ncbi:hypothetical protein NCC78_27020 [Micromonospora phytophila]|uniref:hypothetical protein n=1 Tax=Micromonospora phytophila TaxID=709888 RepID=UPI00202F4298|nr:hypothetical protein [Micromonospora phytophila]MCM0678298.1 hypothetical protein [Micromonospora phytophila]